MSGASAPRDAHDATSMPGFSSLDAGRGDPVCRDAAPATRELAALGEGYPETGSVGVVVDGVGSSSTEHVERGAGPSRDEPEAAL
jgi:hypothetical protein